MSDMLSRWDALQERHRVAQEELERVREAKSVIVEALLADGLNTRDAAQFLHVNEKTILRLVGLDPRRNTRRRGGFGTAGYVPTRN